MIYDRHLSKTKKQLSTTNKFEPLPITWPEKPTLEGGRFQDHIITLYGPPKIGKTRMCQHFPGVFILPTEPGYKWIKARKQYIPNWPTFAEFINYMKKHPDKQKQIKLYCIDTVTNLAKYCMQWTCQEKLGIEHPSDQEWGKGWEAYYDEFADKILALCSLGAGVLFVAHEIEIEIVSRHIKVTKFKPDLPKTVYRLINNLSNMILHMAYVEKSASAEELGVLRCLYTKPSELRDAGDQTGRLPEVIKFRTEKMAVIKILKCFENRE